MKKKEKLVENNSNNKRTRIPLELSLLWYKLQMDLGSQPNKSESYYFQNKNPLYIKEIIIVDIYRALWHRWVCEMFLELE